MYHLSTFRFQKNEGVNKRVAEGVSKYLPKCYDIKKISTFLLYILSVYGSSEY